MPDFDLDAALTWHNPLAGAPIYLRETQNAIEAYALHDGFHYIGSLLEISRTLELYECQSPFEVQSVDLVLDEGVAHLTSVAGKFMSENPERFLKGRKSYIENAWAYRPHA